MRNSSVSQKTITERSFIGYNKPESSHLLSPPNYGKVLNSIASINNYFVGVLTPPSTKIITSGSSSIILSDDAINWKELEFESKRFYRSIASSHNIYFAVGQGQYSNSGSIAISTDRQNWQEVYTGPITLTHAFFHLFTSRVICTWFKWSHC